MRNLVIGTTCSLSLSLSHLAGLMLFSLIKSYCKMANVSKSIINKNRECNTIHFMFIPIRCNCKGSHVKVLWPGCPDVLLGSFRWQVKQQWRKSRPFFWQSAELWATRIFPDQSRKISLLCIADSHLHLTTINSRQHVTSLLVYLHQVARSLKGRFSNPDTIYFAAPLNIHKGVRQKNKK